jgi:hypothetical protein
VLRLRWVRMMPSMMVMPMPGRSPSCAQDVLARRMLRLVHDDGVGRRPTSMGMIQRAHRAVCRSQSGSDLGRHLINEDSSDTMQDAERLHAGTGRRVGAEDDAVRSPISRAVPT